MMFATSGEFDLITNWYFGEDCVNSVECSDDWVLFKKRNVFNFLKILNFSLI